MAIIYGNRGYPPKVQDVSLKDQSTATVVLPLVQPLGVGYTAAVPSIDDRSVSLTDATGFVVGDHFRIINASADRYYSGYITGISGNVVSLDTPIDYAFMAGSQVTRSNTNMAVDGSTTPVSFVLRTGVPSIPSPVDITRIMMVAECSSSVDLNKFGSIPALTNGVVFRKINETAHNIFNVKSNKDLALLAYDWTPFVASNPSQGIDGFACRLTFSGKDKLGVVLRVEQSGQLEVLVQDDLTGFVSLSCVVEGHVAED